jgi:PKD repeat protein
MQVLAIGPPLLRLKNIYLLAVALFGLTALPESVMAQEAREASKSAVAPEKGSIYQRKVQIPPGSPIPPIVMTEFFTEGELDSKGESVTVYDARHNLVPWRVLQVGPGDFCRMAFQTSPRQSLYKIHYGGKADSRKPPGWTSDAGLLMETRHWRACELNHLESVREALKRSEVYGRGYVPSVFHRFNPFWPETDPFLSEYQGVLRITNSGLYKFFTSSQDCSFLLIDGKVVVAAPGWHGPVGDARFKGEVDLRAGLHEFQYIHGAAGADACMVAAWQPPGVDKPELIPPQAFDSEAIARYSALSVNRPHEFSVEILGEVPVAESQFPLVRTQFRFVSTRGFASRAKIHWDFGDGQTSAQTDPIHIYLRPGLYTVTMKVSGDAETLAATNRVSIHRALVFPDQDHPVDELTSYLALLDKYNPAKLDPGGLLQLVRAFDQAGFTVRAVKAGEAGVLVKRDPMEREDALTAVRLVGVLLRDRLDDPTAALAFWQGAAKVLEPGAWKAECEVEAADVALNMLLKDKDVKGLLESASARLGNGGVSGLGARLNRVWGDWYARKGDRSSATAAYGRAMAATAARRSAAEQEAWRGARSRSTEEFLREKSLDGAWTELLRWQDEYPIDKIEGYLSLLLARYWAGKAKWAQAVASAGDLVAINPDSPYADRLVFLGAECEEKIGRTARARAGYRSLLSDYPGSPLVNDAKKKLAGLIDVHANGGQRK